MSAFLQNFLRSVLCIPLTLKMLLATTLVALTTWTALDYWQTNHLTSLFQDHLAGVVRANALKNRMVFDNYIKDHHQAVKLLASQKDLLDYVHSWQWLNARPEEVVFHVNTPPPWLPRPSVLRSFVPLRYVLLLRPDGGVAEVYQSQPDPVPTALLGPTFLLRKLSHNQTFLTSVDQQPYLITSETVDEPGQNKNLATLMLASPLDNTFLVDSQGPMLEPSNYVALLEGEHPAVIASSHPELVTAGTRLEELGQRFVVAGQSFFDYGSSDLLLQLVTLVSTSEFESLGRTILRAERQQRLITAAALILPALLIMLYITRNIARVTKGIVDFTRDLVGIEPQEVQRRDEIAILKEHFDHLAREVARTRDELKGELTTRTKVEEELHKLSQAVEQSPTAVMITDPLGRIEYVNPQFTRLTGYQPEEVQGRNPRLLQSSQTPRETYRELWETILAGRTWQGELHNVRKNGKPYWERNTISAIRNAHNEVTHYVAVKEDISLRIEMEQVTQRAREAAEAANQVKNDFLSNITHELRTPLNAIVGFTSLTLEKEFGELNKVQKRHMKTVLESANQLSGIIDDLLDLSKVDSEQFNLEKSPFSLMEVVRSTEAAVAIPAAEKGLTLTCDIPEDLPGQVLGDPTRLRQTLLYVLRNAVKFTPRGTISFQVGWRPACEGSGVEVTFVIRDSGIGIPEDKLETIFDPFTQVDSSFSREHGGTGLGLTIAKRLIEMMNGRIEVESIVNQGSTFRITVAMETPALQMVHADICPMLPGMRVMVSGKNPVNRLILKKLLSVMEVVVEEETNCSSAIQEMERSSSTENPIRILFWDCYHGMDNALEEALRSLREIPGLGEMPVVLFSVDPSRERVLCHGFPRVYYLHKPIQRTEVYEVVMKALDQPPPAT